MIIKCDSCKKQLRFPDDKHVIFNCPNCNKEYVFRKGKRITLLTRLKKVLLYSILSIILLVFGFIIRERYELKMQNIQYDLAYEVAEIYDALLFDPVENNIIASLDTLINIVSNETNTDILNNYYGSGKLQGYSYKSEYESELFNQIYSCFEKKINKRIDHLYDKGKEKISNVFPKTQVSNRVAKCVVDNIIHSSIKDNLHSVSKELSRALILRDSIDKTEIISKIDINGINEKLVDVLNCIIEYENEINSSKKKIRNSQQHYRNWTNANNKSQQIKLNKRVLYRIDNSIIKELSETRFYKAIRNWENYFSSNIYEFSDGSYNTSKIFKEYLDSYSNDYFNIYNTISEDDLYIRKVEGYIYNNENSRWGRVRTNMMNSIENDSYTISESLNNETHELLKDWYSIRNRNAILWYYKSVNIEGRFKMLLETKEIYAQNWGIGLSLNYINIPMNFLPNEGCGWDRAYKYYYSIIK